MLFTHTHFPSLLYYQTQTLVPPHPLPPGFPNLSGSGGGGSPPYLVLSPDLGSSCFTLAINLVLSLLFPNTSTTAVLSSFSLLPVLPPSDSWWSVTMVAGGARSEVVIRSSRLSVAGQKTSPVIGNFPTPLVGIFYPTN